MTENEKETRITLGESGPVTFSCSMCDWRYGPKGYTNYLPNDDRHLEIKNNADVAFSYHNFLYHKNKARLTEEHKIERPASILKS